MARISVDTTKESCKTCIIVAISWPQFNLIEFGVRHAFSLEHQQAKMNLKQQ